MKAKYKDTAKRLHRVEKCLLKTPQKRIELEEKIPESLSAIKLLEEKGMTK